MKTNRLVVLGVVLSLLMCAAALALQIKNETEFGSFAKYARPLQLSELEYRKFYALFLMAADYIPENKGVALPDRITISENGSTSIVNVCVVSADLPTQYEERKEHLNTRAMMIGVHLADAFNLDGRTMNRYLEVHFVDYVAGYNAMAKIKGVEKKPKQELDKLQEDLALVAVYKNGQLTMR